MKLALKEVGLISDTCWILKLGEEIESIEYVPFHFIFYFMPNNGKRTPVSRQCQQLDVPIPIKSSHSHDATNAFNVGIFSLNYIFT